MKRFLLICLLGIGCFSGGGAQSRSFNDGYDNYSPYHYRNRAEWRWIRNAVFKRTGLEDSIRLNTLGKTLPNIICPWWIEDLYRSDVVKGEIRRLGYVGYVLDPLTGLPSLVNSWNETTLLDSVWQDIPMDLVVYCRGAEAFDVFLRSDSARMNFIEKVFDSETGMINRLHWGKRPAGLHFYLPDCSFREKRALIRFVQSVSMVIDYYCVKGERIYEGKKCRLTFTFSPEARKELDFLSGVIGLVDEVNLGVYDESGFPLTPIQGYTRENDPASMVARIRNQYYLFSLRIPDEVTETECQNDLYKLAQAEYSKQNWRLYFFVDVLLVVCLIASVVLYHLYSPFYMMVDRYRSLVVPVIITLVTEIMIVFLYMTEALSGTLLFFNLDENTHLYLLALPLIFIVLYMTLKMLGERKQLP